MALVLDTRFLISYMFPPTLTDRDALKRFYSERILGKPVSVSVVSITEFLKIVGRRIGFPQAEIWLKLFLKPGIRAEPVTYVDSIEAGRIICREPDIPIADALIASVAKRLKAIVVTDDPHFRELGIKTIWYR